MLHELLWNENRDLANACLRHPFVQTLADGSLDPAVFRRYVGQDAFFLNSFFQAYAVCAARCRSVEHARVFHALMTGVIDELKLHAEYAERLSIDLQSVKPYPETNAYIHFVLRTAWHNDLGATLAALVPCMRLYAFLGTELAQRRDPDTPYHSWIETYSSREFQELAERIERLLDEFSSDTPAARDAYRYAMQCELDFFTAPLKEGAS